MKRILINAYSAKIGGGQTYLKNLIENFPESGDVMVFVHTQENLDIIVSDPRVTFLKTRLPTKNPFARLFWEFFVLPWDLYRLKIDVLFCPGGIVSGYFPRKCRVVTMFRNMLPFDSSVLASSDGKYLRIKNMLLRRSMLRSMKRADLVIFISHYAKEVIKSLIDVKKSIIVPHGIPSNFSVADISLSRPPLPFEGKYILYVSRFEVYKRHLELVKAYYLLPIEVRSKYKLLIVGGGEKTKEGVDVREYVSKNLLSDDVFLLGEYPYLELPALYKHASLFVFASVCENCPNILLEAMGAGVPIVCSEYQPMPEFGGDSLVYVSPDFPVKMSSKMDELLRDSVLLKTQGEESARQARLYSWKNTARRTWDAILSI